MNKMKFSILIVLTVLLTACGVKKEAIDDEDFGRIMSSEGFNIVNVEQQFVQYQVVEDAYVAKNDNYQIEFYELDEDTDAINFYNTNKSIFESSKTGSSVYTNVDLTDSNRYTLITEESYKVISRIEDTVIYLNVDKKYKEEVNNILKKLGY